MTFVKIEKLLTLFYIHFTVFKCIYIPKKSIFPSRTTVIWPWPILNKTKLYLYVLESTVVVIHLGIFWIFVWRFYFLRKSNQLWNTDAEGYQKSYTVCGSNIESFYAYFASAYCKGPCHYAVKFATKYACFDFLCCKFEAS